MNIIKVVCSNGSEIIPSQGINLIIGGNNTGKSTFIKELGGAIRSGYLAKSTSKWVKIISLKVEKPIDEISSMFGEIENGSLSIADLGNIERENFILDSGFKPNRRNIPSFDQYNARELERVANTDELVIDIKHEASQNREYNENTLIRELLSNVQLSIENCEMRLQEKFKINIPDILNTNIQNSDSVIPSLIKNPILLSELRRNIQSVFNIKIGFDDLSQGDRCLRILPDKLPGKKMSNHERAVAWRDCSPLVYEQGDGMRAYIKLLLNMLDDFYKIVIIDEPEAFLHPPQRRALGKILAEIATKNNKQVFIATHDVEFIKGVLTGNKNNKNLSVFKTSVEKEAHVIKQCNLSTISEYIENKKKIQRVESNKYSEGFLTSLFYNKTILVEDEFDKFFYERYVSLYLDDRALDVNFVGLDGIAKIKKIFDQMRGLEINVACIVDVDFLISEHGVPDSIRIANNDLYEKHICFIHEYRNMSKSEREKFKKKFKRAGIELFKNNPEKIKIIRELIDKYAECGIFIVEVGEVERWYNASKNNDNIRAMLERMEKHSCRKLSGFMKKVCSW